jgi:hypothetical protein
MPSDFVAVADAAAVCPLQTIFQACSQAAPGRAFAFVDANVAKVEGCAVVQPASEGGHADYEGSRSPKKVAALGAKSTTTEEHL